jgi:hypothetical protein
MLDDYRRLIPQLQNAPVLNALLDVVDNSFLRLSEDIGEAFRMLAIDECEGEWLDNLGALIGIGRPTLNINLDYLKTDDLANSLDSSPFFISNAPSIVENTLAPDDYYRMVIKAQIVKNNLQTYSINDLELLAKFIFSQEHITTFYPVLDSETSLTLHINQEFSHLSRAFLQTFRTDVFGRKKWDFPYPDIIQTVTVIPE